MESKIPAPENNKIGKIIKLFLEFVVAAITAWFTASCIKLM